MPKVKDITTAQPRQCGCGSTSFTPRVKVIDNKFMESTVNLYYDAYECNCSKCGELWHVKSWSSLWWTAKSMNR